MAHNLLQTVRMLAVAIAAAGLLLVPVTFAGHVGPGPTGGLDVKVTDDNGNIDGGLAATTPSKDAQNRQSNEPTIAISPRPSPLTGRTGDIIAASATDHRLAPNFEEAWQALYLSFDGGLSWFGAPPFPSGHNTMVPGFPTDLSPTGLASPLKGQHTFFDAQVRFDAAGNLYIPGIAYTVAFEPNQPVDVIMYVARYAFTPGTPAAPSTTTSAGTPPHFTYTRTTVVARGRVGFATHNPIGLPGPFPDKEWLEIDTNSPAASACAGTMYLSLTLFEGAFSSPGRFPVGQLSLKVSRSTNGGASFSAPRMVSTGGPNGSLHTEGSSVAVAANGTVYLAYRTFAVNRRSQDAVYVVKSTDCGQTWTNPVFVGALNDPFTLAFSGPPDVAFRTPTFVNAAVDTVNPSIVYIAYQNFDGTDLDIYVQRSTDGGVTWGPAVRVNEDPGGRHQSTMAPIRVSNGALHVAWYDFRNSTTPGNEALDVYYACTNCAGNVWPVFSHNVRVTDVSHQASCRMFGDGTLAFHGDYIGLDARWNGSNHVVHIAWTDNRNVPAAQCDLSSASGPSGNNVGNRNQNIYTDRLIVAP